jgi:hypothetical protein
MVELQTSNKSNEVARGGSIDVLDVMDVSVRRTRRRMRKLEERIRRTKEQKKEIIKKEHYQTMIQNKDCKCSKCKCKE